MKNAYFSLLAATMLLTTVNSASAQGILSVGVTDVRNQTITLNGNTAWVAFSDPNGSPGTAVTNAANPGGFTDLTGSITNYGGDSLIGITYTGGVYDTTGTSSASNTKIFAYTYSTFSTTSTLFADNETFNLYLSTYYTPAPTLAFTLASSAGGNTLATLSTSNTLFSADGARSYGEVTINVTGAAIGDVLTITESIPSGGANAGLNAISANMTVPEPGSLVQGLVLLLGLVTLGTARGQASSSRIRPAA